MNVRRIVGLFIPNLRHPIRCDSCGDDFICGASLTGCWCAEIKLDGEARAELRKRFRDCLCQKCLEAASETTLTSGD